MGIFQDGKCHILSWYSHIGRSIANCALYFGNAESRLWSSLNVVVSFVLPSYSSAWRRLELVFKVSILLNGTVAMKEERNKGSDFEKLIFF